MPDLSCCPKKTYDLIVIGSGQAGNPLASEFLARGKRVAIVERDQVGGSCVNYGCTPTKTMIASAEVAHTIREASKFGIDVSDFRVNLSAVVARKDRLVDRSRSNNEKKLSEGVMLYRGQASFTAPKEIRVDLTDGSIVTITAGIIVIDTGSSPVVPKIPGLDSVPYVDNRSIMELTELPQHLVVLGGSYLGLEFAQMFQRFGSSVT